MKTTAQTLLGLRSVLSILALGWVILGSLVGNLSGQVSGAVSPPDDVNQIFQYFAPSTIPKARQNSGAYLWIPPAAPQIRAVIVGIQNGLPIVVLQNPAIRAVCRKYGIAEILLTPNGSEIGPVMLKDLNYDVTNPEVTAVYDQYLQRLADLSGHPELVKAPIVPMAHSAYCAFPFAAAMRDPAHCLTALPIKAGMPDLYAFFGPGGKAFKPDPSLCLRNVPILFISSASQETVGWSAYPARSWRRSASRVPARPRRQSGHHLRAAQRDVRLRPGTWPPVTSTCCHATLNSSPTGSPPSPRRVCRRSQAIRSGTSPCATAG